MARRRNFRRYGRRVRRAGRSMGKNPMAMLGRILGPVFNIFALDIAARQIQTLTASGSLSGKIPPAGLAAISLSFNLARLKLSTHFTKGLPFGIGTFANLAVKLSALQIGLQALPVFFDPRAYSVGPSADYPESSLPGQPSLGTSLPNVGQVATVTAGVDSGRSGPIETVDGSGGITIQGISNYFRVGEYTV